MTITNPTLELTFTEDNTTVTITGADIVSRSISITKQLLNELSPSSNTIEIKLARNCSSIEDIIANESDIKAVLKNNGTAIFTGYVSEDSSWVVTMNGEQALSITLEDVGTRLFEKEFISSGYHTFNCTCQAAVSAICTAAGVTIASNAVFPVGDVIHSIEGATTCKDLISSLLAEFNCVYYFNAQGQMLIHQISCTSTSSLPEFNKANLYEVGGTCVRLSKQIRQYKNARVTYKEIGTASNYLIYRNTTKDQEGGKYCYLELAGGEHFDGTEKYTPSQGETRSPAYIEAVNAASEGSVGSSEILVVSSPSAVTDTFGTLSATVNTSGGKYFTLDAENTGATVGYFKQLDIIGSIIYVKSENVIVTADEQVATTQSNNIVEEELTWVHTKALAQARANMLAQYHRYAGATYTFYSTTSMALGTVCRLNENEISGLDVNVMLISSRETDESGVIEYTAVGMSVFDLTAVVTEARSAVGAVGEVQGSPKTTAITKQFSIGSSSTEAPTTGWTEDRASLTPTSESPYTWVKETISYSDGTSSVGTAYVGEVYVNAEVMEYSLGVSPANVIKNLRSTGSQSITLSARISGYSDYVVNYMFAGQFLGSKYGVTSDQSAVEGKKYYTFAQTSDQTPQTGKKYYTVASEVYTESVNVTVFITGTTYYERSEVQYTSGVYEETFNAHASSISLSIPYINSYINKVSVSLYNGENLMDSLELAVMDKTGEPVFIGATATMPPTYAEQFIDGDYCVLYADQTGYNKGRTYIYNNGSWSELSVNTGTATQFYNSVKSLQDVGITLASISDQETISYYNSIYANDIIGGQIKAINGFFTNITIENATFTDGDIILSQLKTQVGSAGDPTGVTLPAYSKWNVKEIYDSISDSNSVLTASGNYGGTSVSQVIKLTNPNSDMYPAVDTGNITVQSANTAQTYTLGDVSAGSVVTITGKGCWAKQSAWSENFYYLRQYFKDDNGNVLYTYTTKSVSKSDVETTTFSFTVNSNTTIYCQVEQLSDKSCLSRYSGMFRMTAPSKTFASQGFTSTGIWLNAGSWQNLGTNTLYPSSTALTLTINGTTYTKSDHYSLATNFATYDYNSLLLNRAYAVTSTNLYYQGVSKTASFFKKLSSTTAILILSDGQVVNLISGEYVYLQGTIKIASTNAGLVVQDIIPELDNTYSIGRADKQIKDLYVKGLHTTVEGSSTHKTGSAVVISIYCASDGSAWYRIWSDGWIEQGGAYNLAGTNSSQVFNLVTAFSNANYTILKTSSWLYYGTPNSDFFNIVNKTTTTFTTSHSAIMTGGGGFSWYACGY